MSLFGLAFLLYCFELSVGDGFLATSIVFPVYKQNLWLKNL